MNKRYHRLETAEQRDVDDAMDAARGLSANVVARLATRHHRAVNYLGCGKRHIFVDMVEDGALDRTRDNALVGRAEETWTRRELWWNQFLDDLRNEPRPPTRAERLAARKRAEREEAEERRREAEGWSATSAKARLRELAREAEPLRQRIREIQAEIHRLIRIVETLESK